MPLSIDPAALETGAELAVGALLAFAPIPAAVADALKAVLPALVGFIATEIEGGRDPKPSILALTLAGADAAADAAQTAKFPA